MRPGGCCRSGGLWLLLGLRKGVFLNVRSNDWTSDSGSVDSKPEEGLGSVMSNSTEFAVHYLPSPA
jgi:hypothetical protein